MLKPLTIECDVACHRVGHGAAKALRLRGDGPTLAAAGPRVPRIARLLALAWRLEHLIGTGVLKDQAAAARLGRVSRARVAQLLLLVNLAPDIQEALLFYRSPPQGRAGITLRQVLPIAALLDWHQQRQRWRNGRKCSMASNKRVNSETPKKAGF